MRELHQVTVRTVLRGFGAQAAGVVELSLEREALSRVCQVWVGPFECRDGFQAVANEGSKPLMPCEACGLLVVFSQWLTGSARLDFTAKLLPATCAGRGPSLSDAGLRDLLTSLSSKIGGLHFWPCGHVLLVEHAHWTFCRTT